MDWHTGGQSEFLGAMKQTLKLPGGTDSGETAGITLAIGADKS